MKKILIAVLTVVALACCFSACNNKPSGNPSAEINPLEFASETLSIEMFKEMQLDYDVKGVITEEIKFSSSNTAVVTVNDNGKIVAVKEGSAVVTMSAGNAFDTLNVMVTPCDKSKLELFYEFDSLNIYETYSKEIKPIVLYDGAEVDGGEFVYTLSNENVSLSENTITGQSKGNSTLTISGSIRGIALNSLTVQLNVYEKLEILFGDDVADENEIFVFAGSQEQNAVTEFAFNPSVYLNDNLVDSANVTIDNSNSSVIEIVDGKVKAKGVGSANITISYVSEKDTEISKVISVTVSKPLAFLEQDKIEIVKNKAEKIEYALSGMVAVTELQFNGAVINSSKYALNNGVLQIERSAFTNVMDGKVLDNEHDIVILCENEQEKFEISQEITLVDYKIGTADELDQFRAEVLCVSAGTTYALLTANIDASDIAWAIKNCPFTGVFDGQGYTISGINITATGIFRGFKNGTLKNVAFVNIVNNKNASDTSLLTWDGNDSSGVIENVYMQGSFVGAGKNLAGIAWGLAGMTIKNVIIDVEFANGDDAAHYAISGQTSSSNKFNSNSNNVFAISNSAQGFIAPPNEGDPSRIPETMTNYGLYANHNELKQAKLDGEVSFDSFTASCWTLSNGIPLFETAKEYFSIVPEIISATITGTQVEPGEHRLNATFGATITMINDVAGVQLDENVLTVANTAQDGATIQLNVSYVNVYGATCENTVTYTISNLNIVELFDGPQVYGKNRGDLVLDLTAYSLSNLLGVQVGGVNIDSATLNANKLTIPKTAFTANQENTIIAVVDNYKFVATVKTVDFAIGSTDEFVAWAATVMQDRYGKAAPLYSMLTANIDLSGVAFADKAANYTDNTYIATKSRTVYDRTNVGNGKESTSGCGFGYGVLQGELDGQGYTVDGLLHTQGGLFGSVGISGVAGFTLKNIAFTNVELMNKSATTARYIFGSAKATFKLENVYFQITKTSADASTVTNITNDNTQLSLTNCVIDYAFTYAENAPTYTKAGVFNNATPQKGVENVFAISKTTFLASSDTLVPKDGYTYSNNGRYESATALATAISEGTLDMSMFTASSYWDTTVGYPVWKTAKV